MSNRCVIHFDDNPKKIFFSGQKLHITVRLKLFEELKVSGIYIRLRGIAHVRIMTGGFCKFVHNATDEDVFDMRKCLTREKVLPRRTHDYTFTCTLPDDLPSTFAGTLGYIKYSAQVVLRMPFWPDKKFKEEFTVFKTVNLNDYPSLRTEVSEKRFIRPSYISARMTAHGAHGQSVQLEVSVENGAVFALNQFVIYLRRRTKYLKSDQNKTECVDVKQFVMNDWRCENKFGKAEERCKTFRMSFIIPKNIPPTEEIETIGHEYFVMIKARPNDCSIENAFISIELPITIGTVPFSEGTSTGDFNTPHPFHNDDIEPTNYVDALQIYGEIDDNLSLSSAEDTFAQREDWPEIGTLPHLLNNICRVLRIKRIN